MAKDIVVIDDDQGLLEFVTHVFEAEGHSVATFDDGFAALSYLASATPDVILVDYVLPRIDGDDLCRIIRRMAHLESAFVVLISAAVNEIDGDLNDFCVDVCVAKGAFPTMAGHLLEAIEPASDRVGEGARVRVLGAEQVRPRRMTRELFARKRHLEEIIDSVIEGILEVDGERVVYANSAAIRLFELSKVEVLGRALSDLLGPVSAGRVMAEPSAGTKSAALGLPLPLDVNGRKVVVRRFPVEGSTIYLLADVTDQKRLEEQLFRAQKLEAVGTMAGGIAHNFNNLLQGVLGSASLLLTRSDPSAREYSLLKHIEHCGERGAELTRQLLEFAKGKASGAASVEVDVVLEDALRIFEGSRRATTVVREFRDELWTVEADAAGIEQVILNLCLNASEAMGHGGVIRVETDNVELDGYDVAGYGVESGPYVRIAVVDTGVGIDEKDRDRVFEPFFSTKPPGIGTGLGLSSSFGIVKNHYGIIDFTSSPGQGSTFFVCLPASRAPSSETSREDDETPRGSESILVVDDEDHVLAVCQGMLQDLGYDVEIASGGPEALEVVGRDPRRFDLVVLDVVMPGMSGWEAARRLWALRTELRILFCSGYTPDAASKPEVITGRHAYLQKPFDLAALGREVRRTLDAG